tara:strand:- start:152 stop:385 length:234 start_codon:yes stop_codon:yes gene_type:complete
MAKINYMKISEVYGDGSRSSRRAEVVRKVGVDPRVYGIRMYVEGNLLEMEWMPGYNEQYATDAAENFCLGIKNNFDK